MTGVQNTGGGVKNEAVLNAEYGAWMDATTERTSCTTAFSTTWYNERSQLMNVGGSTAMCAIQP